MGALLPLALFSAAAAAAPERSLTITAQGGGFAVLGDWDLSGDHRDAGVMPTSRVVPQGGLSLGYQLTPRFGLEAEGFVSTVRTNADTPAQVLAGSVTGIRSLTEDDVAPYVLAGAGVYQAANGLIGGDIDPRVHVGGGVRAMLTRRVAVRGDTRYVATDGFGGLGGANVEARLALEWFATLPEKPAPPGDTDGDGLLDPDDECPRTRGLADLRGCPDTDRDGLQDRVDACASDPGPAETRGCPDRDGDRIADREDRCPDVAGVVPRQGCPELDFAAMLTGVQFDSGSARLTRAAKAQLVVIAAVFAEHPSLRVEVAGHTDDEGDGDGNLILSQRRAEAVVDHLVSLGVDGDRLTSVGYGATRPLDPNDTPGGRARNRRIEFRVRSQ